MTSFLIKQEQGVDAWPPIMRCPGLQGSPYAENGTFIAAACLAGLIQAVIFEVNDRDLIGYPTPTGYRYCCTKELVPKTKCFQDRLIYQVAICGLTRSAFSCDSEHSHA